MFESFKKLFKRDDAAKTVSIENKPAKIPTPPTAQATRIHEALRPVRDAYPKYDPVAAARRSAEETKAKLESETEQFSKDERNPLGSMASRAYEAAQRDVTFAVGEKIKAEKQGEADRLNTARAQEDARTAALSKEREKEKNYEEGGIRAEREKRAAEEEKARSANFLKKANEENRQWAAKEEFARKEAQSKTDQEMSSVLKEMSARYSLDDVNGLRQRIQEANKGAVVNYDLMELESPYSLFEQAVRENFQNEGAGTVNQGRIKEYLVKWQNATDKLLKKYPEQK